MNEFDKQAQDFLNKTGAKLTVKYDRHDFYFSGDTERRDIYKVTLRNGRKSYNFTFGQSINNVGNKPSEYDVLACLNPYAISGDFHDFCMDYGYDEYDDESARKIFKAVEKEVAGLNRLFSEPELESLAEIS